MSESVSRRTSLYAALAFGGFRDAEETERVALWAWEHIQQLEAENKLLREALREYADHQSWRCEHPPHFYLADRTASQEIVNRDDCYCGLLLTLRERGVSGVLDDEEAK